MAKFCGKCGAKLDDTTGLCPNCDADKLKEQSDKSEPVDVAKSTQETAPTSEKPLSKKEAKKKRKADKKAKKKEKRAQWSAGKKARRFFLKLALIILFLLIVATGIVSGLSYFGFIQSPAIINVVEKLGIEHESNMENLFEDFANEYQVIAENEDGTYTIEIIAPDFASILQKEIESNPTSTLNSETIKGLIERYPDLKKSYEFTVASKKKTDIQMAFLQQVSYDLMVSAIMDVSITEPQKQEVAE